MVFAENHVLDRELEFLLLENNDDASCQHRLVAGRSSTSTRSSLRRATRPSSSPPIVIQCDYLHPAGM